MGDSTCLMSFSPGMPSESNKHGNHVHCLGDSVSFGRFTTESLAWDKWSSSPHKRYVEEAKSYAQPGSVAEKKAFFEAHYKKVAAQKAAAAAAAALLEQEKAKIQVEERVCGTNHDAHDSEPPVLLKSCVLPAGIPKLPALHTMVLHTNKRQPPKLKLKLAVNEGEKITTHNASKEVDVVGHSSGVNLVETRTEKIPKLPALHTMVLHTNKRQPPKLKLKLAVNEGEKITTHNASKEVDVVGHSSGVNLVETRTEKIAEASDPKHKELVNTAENLVDSVSVSEDSGTSQMDRPLLKSKNNDQEVLQPKIRRKPATPSFRSSSFSRNQSRIPHSPAYVASMHPWKDNIVTPRAKNSTSMDSIDKKRSAPRSLYTLMNSGSVKESSKLNSPAVRKMETTKLAPSIHSTPKRSATPKHSVTPNITPSKVTKGVNKQPLATVKRRMETPVHPSAIGSKTPGQKWHIFSAVSKSLSAYKNKLQSPTVSTPFTLRTEERAARRKQKLEEKFNEKEAQKTQLQTTLKEKAETEFRRLRQSFCFKARPLPSFYNERETPKSSTKKSQQANVKSITPARPPPTTISQPPSIKKTSRRLWKTNDQNPTCHPLSSLVASRINRENVSPNIQH